MPKSYKAILEVSLLVLSAWVCFGFGLYFSIVFLTIIGVIGIMFCFEIVTELIDGFNEVANFHERIYDGDLIRERYYSRDDNKDWRENGF